MNGRVFSSVNHHTATHKLQPALFNICNRQQFGIGTVWEATEFHDLVSSGYWRGGRQGHKIALSTAVFLL